MKVSREQKAENRRKILDAAARLFRERGIDAIGVDAVMAAAGLTHGAFYGHFASKNDLVAQAFDHAMSQADDAWRSATDPTKRLGELYLATEHCEHPGEGCALATLGPEVSRHGAAIQRALATGLHERVDALAALLEPGSVKERRAEAIATWATLVGAMVLARGVDDPKFRDEILAAGKKSVTRSATKGRTTVTPRRPETLRAARSDGRAGRKP
ncbi:MAG: transcriptional regulator, TetR family [Myxococcaceae bacterium]|nr:transcriptional regulator, TetR family [Myxococcaceae bacterium]MEA2747411.1 TetR/AcrR family transcriptional regulator, transcriptional repressor for nem operon [Myxococcales bacterium]